MEFIIKRGRDRGGRKRYNLRITRRFDNRRSTYQFDSVASAKQFVDGYQEGYYAGWDAYQSG